MLERLWRGEGEERDRVRDDTLDRRMAEIMERSGCDWVDAWAQGVAEQRRAQMRGGRGPGTVNPVRRPDDHVRADRCAPAATCHAAGPGAQDAVRRAACDGDAQ